MIDDKRFWGKEDQINGAKYYLDQHDGTCYKTVPVVTKKTVSLQRGENADETFSFGEKKSTNRGIEQGNANCSNLARPVLRPTEEQNWRYKPQ